MLLKRHHEKRGVKNAKEIVEEVKPAKAKSTKTSTKKADDK